MKLTEAKLKQLIKEGFDEYLASQEKAGEENKSMDNIDNQEKDNTELINKLKTLVDLISERKKYGIRKAIININGRNKIIDLTSKGSLFGGGAYKDIEKTFNDKNTEFANLRILFEPGSKLENYIKGLQKEHNCNVPVYDYDNKLLIVADVLNEHEAPLLDKIIELFQ